MEFSWQQYWSRLPFPSPGDLPNPGIQPGSPAFQAGSLQSEAQGKPHLSMILMLNSHLWMRMREGHWPAFVAEANLLCFSFLSSAGTSSLFSDLVPGTTVRLLDGHCLLLWFSTCSIQYPQPLVPCLCFDFLLHKIMYSSSVMDPQDTQFYWVMVR